MDDLPGTSRPRHDPRPAGDCAVDAPLRVVADERRRHLKAYLRWTALLDGRALPSIADIDLVRLGDFASNGVLLDLTASRDDPAIRHLGARLVEEGRQAHGIASIGAVPPGSLLSRLTDRYAQVLARRAPLAFDAEFVSRHGLDTLCRGILMPFSADGAEIDHIVGIITWKELADSAITASLVDQLRQTLRDTPSHERARSPWAEVATAAAGTEPQD